MLKGPPKKGPTLPLIGKGYVQANITEIRRIAASVRFRLERVAVAEQRRDDLAAALADRHDDLAADPKNKKFAARVKIAKKALASAEDRLKNACSWAKFTEERLDLYLRHALKTTLKNKHPAARGVWTELRLLDQQRRWEQRHNYSKSFVEFLRTVAEEAA